MITWFPPDFMKHPSFPQLLFFSLTVAHRPGCGGGVTPPPSRAMAWHLDINWMTGLTRNTQKDPVKISYEINGNQFHGERKISMIFHTAETSMASLVCLPQKFSHTIYIFFSEVNIHVINHYGPSPSFHISFPMLVFPLITLHLVCPRVPHIKTHAIFSHRHFPRSSLSPISWVISTSLCLGDFMAFQNPEAFGESG